MKAYTYVRILFSLILLAPVAFVFSSDIIEQIIAVVYAFAIWQVIKPSAWARREKS